MSPASGTSSFLEKDLRPVVFIVDDEVMLLELNAAILEPLGYQVLTFRDPVAAVRAYVLADPQPVLIITDYAMNSMNGMDVITACRRVNSAQKFIMLSGTMDEIIFEGAADVPNRFLAKPYQCQQLTDLVHEVLAADSAGCDRAGRA